ANEAPPAIVSIFLGEELTAILDAIESGEAYKDKEKFLMEIGATVLPHIPKDTTDRNRTSPFAFTGNKFEFRMLGSAFSVSGPNIILNTIVAESVSVLADKLENSKDFNADLAELIKSTYKAHKRIVFNGNGYEEEWTKEAEKRGLSNLKSTVEALPAFVSQKSIDVLTKHHVFTESEIHSRYEILLENYVKTLHIEALTMVDMVKKGVSDSVIHFQNDLTDLLTKKKALNSGIESEYEENLLKRVSMNATNMFHKLETLEKSIIETKNHDDALDAAKFYKEVIFSDLNNLRAVVDELETLIPSNYWNYPTYGEILYSVK
ncbi:MAG: glutamine synthetase, partial [Clostridiales bacterium]|nr:glutamine synthetase [Clostridiales bacterium]